MIIQIIVTACASYFSQKYLPWWSISIVSLIVSLIFSKSKLYAFLGGFIGVALLNTSYAAIINTKNASILTKKIMALIPSEYVSDPNILIAVTGVIFGLVGGMGALSGALIKSFTKQ